MSRVHSCLTDVLLLGLSINGITKGVQRRRLQLCVSQSSRPRRYVYCYYRLRAKKRTFLDEGCIASG